MLELSRSCYEGILDHARASVPEEACGVLVGTVDADSTDGGSTDAGATDDDATDDGSTDAGSTDDDATDPGSSDDGSTDDGPSRVEAVVRVANVAEHPRTTYRIDPEELFAVVEQIEERGREVVGFYHSHPSGPRGPSRTDVARATWTDHVYLVVSLDGDWPFLGAWIWDGERFVDETVRVV